MTPLLSPHMLPVPTKSSETRAILLLISDNRAHVRVRYTEDRPGTRTRSDKPPRLLAADGYSNGGCRRLTNLAVKDAARRYSPAEVVAVSRDVVSGIPTQVSTSYVERQNLTLRMSQKRFARLTSGFSKNSRITPPRSVYT